MPHLLRCAQRLRFGAYRRMATLYSDIRYFRRTYACAHDTFPFPALALIARHLPENFLCALTGCVQETKIARCPLRELEETGSGDHKLNLLCATNAGLGQPTKCEGPTSALT